MKDWFEKNVSVMNVSMYSQERKGKTLSRKGKKVGEEEMEEKTMESKFVESE